MRLQMARMNLLDRPHDGRVVQLAPWCEKLFINGHLHASVDKDDIFPVHGQDSFGDQLLERVGSLVSPNPGRTDHHLVIRRLPDDRSHRHEPLSHFAKANLARRRLIEHRRWDWRFTDLCVFAPRRAFQHRLADNARIAFAQPPKPVEARFRVALDANHLLKLPRQIYGLLPGQGL